MYEEFIKFTAVHRHFYKLSLRLVKYNKDMIISAEL